MSDSKIEQKISSIMEQADGKILVRITELNNLPVVIDFLENENQYSVSFVSDIYSNEEVAAKVEPIINELLEMIISKEI